MDKEDGNLLVEIEDVLDSGEITGEKAWELFNRVSN